MKMAHTNPLCAVTGRVSRRPITRGSLVAHHRALPVTGGWMARVAVVAPVERSTVTAAQDSTPVVGVTRSPFTIAGADMPGSDEAVHRMAPVATSIAVSVFGART